MDIEAKLFRNRKGFLSINVQAVPDQILNFKTLLFDGPEAFTTPEYLKIVVYVPSLSIITWQRLITWLETNSLMMDFSNSEKYCLGWDIWHICTACVMCQNIRLSSVLINNKGECNSGKWQLSALGEFKSTNIFRVRVFAQWVQQSTLPPLKLTLTLLPHFSAPHWNATQVWVWVRF